MSSMQTAFQTALSFISFEYPEWWWIAIPLIIASIVITYIRFVKIPEDEQKSAGRIRMFMIVTRTLMIFLVVLALTGPFYSQEITGQGDPTIMLLLDNSTSMELFDIDTTALKGALEEEVPVTSITIASGELSQLGDAVFRQLQHQNLLLVTDGNNDPAAMNFVDLAGYAEKFNATINVVELGDQKSDAAISINGPPSSIIETEYYFTLALDNMNKDSRVIVTVDGMTIYEEKTVTNTIDFKHKFTRKGYHQIVATLEAEDYFTGNNKWHHIVEVVEKPKILYMGYRKSEFDRLLPERYELTSVTSLPNDLSQYFAVAINDVMHDLDAGDARTLETYTDDGNGLVVWGGLNSWQGQSEIDYLLPVKPGETEENENTFNFILVVDMSGIVQLSMTETEIAAAALIDVLADRKENVKMGVVDFSYAGHVVYPLSDGSLSDSMKQAMNDFQDTTTIDGTLWLRPAALNSGLALAREMFIGVQGNNNIIVVTDGNIHGEKYLPKAVKEIEELTKMGVRVHVYDYKNEHLDDSVLRKVRQYISSLGGGMLIWDYFSLNSLFEKALIVANYNHYITKDLSLAAVITGENKVARAPSGKTLITTGTGLPIVVTNSYNKIAAVATDDGYDWAEDLASEVNEHLVYRVFDWAIGDPNRKKRSYARVDPGTVGDETKVYYKGATYPNTDRCTFLPVDDHYECSLIPTKAGFDNILGVPFAVNYKEEYRNVGYNSGALNSLTDRTDGTSFGPGEISSIVSKVKSDSKVKILEKHPLDWYVLAVAMLVFLFEIYMRRLLMHRKL
jgi:hypothetical protein